MTSAGFTVRDSIEGASDVVIDTEGLVTYAGIHARCPAAVADALLRRGEIELALNMEGGRVLVRDRRGRAAIEKKGGGLRYIPLDRDVLQYRPVIDLLKKSGRLTSEGFASAEDWLSATVEHEWPNAPPRIWDAFHGIVVCTPDLMVTLKDGYHSGMTLFESCIDLRSAHGGLNQVNSATFLLSMTGRTGGPLRSRDVLDAIEPGYRPCVHDGK